MIEYGFFDAINGDRRYNSKNFSDYFEGLIGDGVFAQVGESLRVSSGNGLNVSVGTGRAKVLNRYIKNTSPLTITISAADSINPRTDAIVVGVNLAERIGEIKVIQGTPNAAADRPTIPSSETLKYYPLAFVKVEANATEVYASNVTDMRGTAECPWVAGLVEQIDTSAIVAQYQAMINEFETEAQQSIDLVESESQLAMQNYERQAQESIARINEFYETMRDQLQIQTRLRKLVYELTAKQSFVVDMTTYNPETDILDIYLNGVYLTPIAEWDYDQNTNTVTISRTFSGTNNVLQVCFTKTY